MNNRYVVDENGEPVAVLLDIEDYERMVAQHHAPAAEDEPPNDEDGVLDPDEAERRITEFVTNADDLPGSPVADLTEDVTKLMRAAWRDVEAIMDAIPNNKVLAVELFLGQQARGLQPDNPEQWRLHAAISLLSGIHLGKAGKRGQVTLPTEVHDRAALSRARQVDKVWVRWWGSGVVVGLQNGLEFLVRRVLSDHGRHPEGTLGSTRR